MPQDIFTEMGLITITYLKLEESRWASKDGRSKVQPEKDGQSGRKQATKVQVLPTSCNQSCSWEACKGQGCCHKCTKDKAGETKE